MNEKLVDRLLSWWLIVLFVIVFFVGRMRWDFPAPFILGLVIAATVIMVRERAGKR